MKHTGNRQQERKGWESSHVCYYSTLSAPSTWSNTRKGLRPPSTEKVLLYTVLPYYFINLKDEAVQQTWWSHCERGTLPTCFMQSTSNIYVLKKSSESRRGCLYFTVDSFFPPSFTLSEAGTSWMEMDSLVPKQRMWNLGAV